MQSHMYVPADRLIELNLLPILNPTSYGGARVLEASGRPIADR